MGCVVKIRENYFVLLASRLFHKKLLLQFDMMSHHRRGPVPDLLVLQVSQFTEDLGSWVLHLQQLQDGRPIVGDGHILLYNDNAKTLKQTKCAATIQFHQAVNKRIGIPLIPH